MIAAIILAAGESSRMGRLKQLLPWDGIPLLAWQIRQAQDGGVDDVVVVLGHEHEQIRQALTDAGETARIVTNHHYRQGRSSSLRAGAEALPDEIEAVVVMSVDQPRPSWLLRRLLDHWRETNASIVLPESEGRRGHPVVLHGDLLPALRQVTEAGQGLRAIIREKHNEIATLALTVNRIEVDINFPADYDSALREFKAGNWQEL